LLIAYAALKRRSSTVFALGYLCWRDHDQRQRQRTRVDDTSGAIYKEIAEVAATRSGSTATCTVKVPYSWGLSSASDTVQLEYDVVVPTSLVTTNTAPSRDSTRTSAIALPLKGATTTLTADITI
jgi:hypothetical protein